MMDGKADIEENSRGSIQQILKGKEIRPQGVNTRQGVRGESQGTG